MSSHNAVLPVESQVMFDKSERKREISLRAIFV